MSRFLIRDGRGVEFELTDLDVYLNEYADNGFEIVTAPPTGYDVPDVKAAKAERRDAAKKAADKAAAKADAPTKDA